MENFSLIAKMLRSLKNNLVENKIITMGLFPENILFQKVDKDNTVIRVVDDIGSAALIPLEYYFSFLAKKRINKRWARFLETLKQMYPSETMNMLVKKLI